MIVARALTPRTLIAVTFPSHHKQWSRASFKIKGEEGRFCSDSLRIGLARYGIQVPTPHYLYRRGN
jgi:hypothetical protein